MEPWLAIRYNLTPFWTIFPVKQSFERLQEYLKMWQRKGIKNGFSFLFYSGAYSIGLAKLDEWKGLLEGHFASQGMDKARGKKFLLGTDENAFPKDFGFPARYQVELARAVGEEGQYVMPPSLSLDDFEHYMQNGHRYGVYYTPS